MVTIEWGALTRLTRMSVRSPAAVSASVSAFTIVNVVFPFVLISSMFMVGVIAD